MKFNKKSGAFVGLAALAAIGGTWAYYNQSAALTNPFSTKSYNTSVVEHFNPAEGENWEPGHEVDKMVLAKNTGDYPVLVRVKMNEQWQRAGENAPFKTLDSTTDKEAIKSVTKSGEGSVVKYSAKQNDPDDGKVPATLNDNGGDDTVVYKNLNDVDALTEADKNNWYFNAADGYWYWYGVLESDQATGSLMESVTLASDTDMGLYHATEYYYTINKENAGSVEDKDGHKLLDTDGKINAEFNIDSYLDDSEGKKWLAVNDGESASDHATKDVYFFRKSNNDMSADKGYADAFYDLTITTDFVQATKDAAWEGTPAEILKLLDPETAPQQ